MIDVRVQSADFDPGLQLARLGESTTTAIIGFVGRAATGDEVEAITIDHHPALARSELARIAEEAQARWPVDAIVLIHRHGRIAPGGNLLFAGVASSAIESAGEACAWLVAETRRRAPFWRKELLVDGTSRWFEPSR